MHGLKYYSCRFWQRTDSPPGSNMLRAEIQRALRRAPRQLRRLARLANSLGLKSFRCPRWRIKFSLERFSDLSHICLRAQPLKNSAGRVPQAADCTCNQTPFNWIVSVAEDCLSPAGSFHGCSHMHFRGCIRGCLRGCLRGFKPQRPHHIQLETSLRIFSLLNQIIIKTAPAIAHRNPKPMLNKPISFVAD